MCIFVFFTNGLAQTKHVAVLFAVLGMLLFFTNIILHMLVLDFRL